MGIVISHGGGADGYTSYLGFSLDHGVGAIVLTNTGAASLEPLGEWFIQQAVYRQGRP